MYADLLPKMSCPHLAIFGPEKMPPLGTTDLSCYGEDCIDMILKHYGKDLIAESVLAEESVNVLSQLWFPLISLRNGKRIADTSLNIPRRT